MEQAYQEQEPTQEQRERALENRRLAMRENLRPSVLPRLAMKSSEAVALYRDNFRRTTGDDIDPSVLDAFDCFARWLAAWDVGILVTDDFDAPLPWRQR